MGSGAASGLVYVGVGGIGMSCKDHFTCTVGDAIVGVGGEVIKELEHVYVCVIGGRGLLLGRIAEGYQEFVVNNLGIISDGSQGQGYMQL